MLTKQTKAAFDELDADRNLYMEKADRLSAEVVRLRTQRDEATANNSKLMGIYEASSVVEALFSASAPPRLYRVTIQKGTSYYVVASDPAAAYKRVRDLLDANDWCFYKDRELRSVELVAECSKHPDCGTILLIGGEPK